MRTGGGEGAGDGNRGYGWGGAQGRGEQEPKIGWGALGHRGNSPGEM